MESPSRLPPGRRSGSAVSRWPICCGCEPTRPRRWLRKGADAGKSVIMVFLHGGPSHLDMYDMKPAAPSRVPRRVSADHEQRARHGDLRADAPSAAIMDKLAILRGLHFVEEHSAHSLWTGFPERVERPAFGSVVSYLKGKQDGLPPYVSLMNQPLSEDPAYCGRPIGRLCPRVRAWKTWAWCRACRSIGSTIASLLLKPFGFHSPRHRLSRRVGWRRRLHHAGVGHGGLDQDA